MTINPDYYGSKCYKCDVRLTPDNTYPSRARRNIRICKLCHRIMGRRYYYRDTYYMDRLLIIKKLGGVCARCGFSDIRALQIDHIHGDGHKDRKKYSYKRFIKATAKLHVDEIQRKYQILCANCNWIKRVENKEGSGLIDLPAIWKSLT